GGVKYIDCKNPSEGSLGANFPWIIEAMKKLVLNDNSHFLSATIGDFPYLPGSASLAALGAAVAGADVIKVGLEGPRNEGEGTNLMKAVVKSVKDYNDKIEVVAAGYADHSRMDSSPHFLEIPSIAKKSNSDFAMLDTYIKDGKGLFDFLSVNDLIEFKNKARKLNLKVALAGNLMTRDLKKIKEIMPDVIGVRSVVCEGFDRDKGSIKQDLIERLKSELNK
ncbi:MAG: hypothetical protein EU539_06820, partial [Promethearchaeota archaeon]